MAAVLAWRYFTIVKRNNTGAELRPAALVAVIVSS